MGSFNDKVTSKRFLLENTGMLVFLDLRLGTSKPGSRDQGPERGFPEEFCEVPRSVVISVRGRVYRGRVCEVR